ncbi:histidine kinase [Actinoplanes sp. SE50]|uniref:GAF domain-containing protein n=1 Tax=unclassified Actinoplanes TaxID=2626549 RepID=UPI00023EBF1D|nr:MULTISPECIES: GAF domain-containing protein [unclassified Actinoplanes]AEV85116.1 putative GAF sensor protein [Actinoplanes sp. SE50/110]ATO83507.1 histidine kinase [Actinoplanes sp. SE50]SLM00914.1 histidine kinase [Actinoplanes sp. SE50/110]
MNTITTTELFSRLGQPARIQQIARYDVFDSTLQAQLDALSARTADLLGTPVSMVSVVLDSSQFIIGQHGVPGWMAEVQGTPAEWALCSHTVLAGEPYCIADGTVDPVHADNPLFAMAPIRSYAGVPLTDDSGHVLGAHCVIDVVPRTFTDADIATLTTGATEAMRLLTEHRTRPHPAG